MSQEHVTGFHEAWSQFCLVSFLLNVEDNMAGFLGILMEHQEDGSIKLNRLD